MKYILLCALLISGAFFSMSGHSQDQQPPAYTCPDGGTYIFADGVHMCTVPAGGPGWKAYIGSATSGTFDAFANSKEEAFDKSCEKYAAAGATSTDSVRTYRVRIDRGYTYQHCSIQTMRSQYNSFTDSWSEPYPSSTSDIPVQTRTTENFCPPDSNPGFTNLGDPSGTPFCWKSAVPEDIEPCDCSELAGEGTLPYTSFISQKGVYSAANPPQCNTVTDPDTGQQCHCQLVAQKWLQTTHTNNGVEYDRWSPLPYDRDKPSGTYTGVACGDEDADTAPPEKEECFTLKSGVKWCFANPDEKCTVVNGQQQCSTGCGYVNGDFVCYEDKDPIIPDRPNEDMEEIDDTITDPDKTMPDINKADLKQIQRGTEQRLDNVIIGVNNNNNQLQNIGDKIGQTNSKLDGIGEQLDGQGKSLKGIADGIEDAFGDEGSPDGECEGECTSSWYESAYPDGIVGIWEEHKQAFDQTPAFQFLNQFKVTPSGSQPDWSLCFNLGPMGDFGCDSIAVPDFVWNFIKICILITAAFLCRALIFGG